MRAQRLWEPSKERMQTAAITRFADECGRGGASYAQLWRWSVEDLDGFWTAAARFLDVSWRQEPARALGTRRMPGTEWFPSGRLSFPEHVFKGRNPDAVAIRFRSETLGSGSWTYGELAHQAARVRDGLVAKGVRHGDRVAAYLPNIPHTVAAMIATSSLGAIWSSAPPEFGVDAAVSRFAQIAPKVLLGIDGYHYKGKTIQRRAESQEIASLIGAELVSFGALDGTAWPAEFAVGPATSARLRGALELHCNAVEFDHPLWILYSSGTTGPPKAIVHSHGGALLELLKTGVLQLDLRPDDRFFWYTTTGWVMWNVLLAALLCGSEAVLYDGPPTVEGLWELAADTGTTFFGCSAAWLDRNRQAGENPPRRHDLGALRAIGATGSPLSAEAYDWVYEIFPSETWLVSISGGTDVITPLLGAAPTVPVCRGELGPAALGVDLQSWSPDGRPLVGEVGEMVVASPLPSMPVMFWGDEDGARLHDAYFTRFPGVWTHGDWLTLTDRGSGIIAGRSDATLNRGGVRIGTAELYRSLDGIPEVLDSLAVDLPREGGDGQIVLFVVLADAMLDGALEARIRSEIRCRCSPRHLPDTIISVRDLPRTMSGKKLEIPIKRVLMGASISSVLGPGVVADVSAFQALIDAAAAAQIIPPRGDR